MKIKSPEKKKDKNIENLLSSALNNEVINKGVKKEELDKKEEILESEDDIKETTVMRDEKEEDDISDQILRWKIEHDEIFETVICNTSFIWKPLTRTEYREAFKEDVLDKDIAIIKAACLYPSSDIIEKIVEKKAGTAYVLTEIILSESGFNVQKSSRI